MRDKHYKVSYYRLSDTTRQRLKKLQIKTGKTFNLLFEELLNNYTGEGVELKVISEEYKNKKNNKIKSTL